MHCLLDCSTPGRRLCLKSGSISVTMRLSTVLTKAITRVILTKKKVKKLKDLLLLSEFLIVWVFIWVWFFFFFEKKIGRASWATRRREGIVIRLNQAVYFI